MGNLIELDHTSSGVQIAAALSRDEEMASLVNLLLGSEQKDLYTEVLNKVNKSFRDLSVGVKLKRKDIKPAVIARIYGASRVNDSEVLSGLLKVEKKECKEVFDVFSDILDESMSGVVKVQEYFKYVAKSLEEAGLEEFDLLLADGSYSTVRLVDGWPDFEVLDSFEVRSEFDLVSKSVKVGFNPPKSSKTFNHRAMVALYIQSFDADILARTKISLVEKGVTLYAKHDAYLLDEKYGDELLESAQQSIYDSFKDCDLDSLVSDLEENYGVELKSFNDLFGYGSYSLEEVLNAQFLLS